VGEVKKEEKAEGEGEGEEKEQEEQAEEKVVSCALNDFQNKHHSTAECSTGSNAEVYFCHRKTPKVI